MDPSRRLVFVTAFHPGKQAVFGYVFRREEYPWTQIWDSYPGGGAAPRTGAWNSPRSPSTCRAAR